VGYFRHLGPTRRLQPTPWIAAVSKAVLSRTADFVLIGLAKHRDSRTHRRKCIHCRLQEASPRDRCSRPSSKERQCPLRSGRGQASVERNAWSTRQDIGQAKGAVGGSGRRNSPCCTNTSRQRLGVSSRHQGLFNLCASVGRNGVRRARPHPAGSGHHWRDITGASGVAIETGIVRFTGRFVCDGLVTRIVHLGPNYRKSYGRVYSAAKAEGRFYVCDEA
jgi:hypothetical protein